MSSSTTLTIAGFDPGKNNFSFSISQVDIKTGLKYKVLTTGMIEHTVTDLAHDLDHQATLFKKEVKAILKKYSVNAFIAERYMVRGRFNGASSEVISFMMGCLFDIRCEKRLITAAQWKNAFNKKFDLNQLYEDTYLVPHIVDSSLIGLYGSSFFLNTKHFDCINNVNKFRVQIEKTQPYD